MEPVVGDGSGQVESLFDQRDALGRLGGSQLLGDGGQRRAADSVVGDGSGQGCGPVEQRRVRGLDGGQPLNDRGQRPTADPVVGDGSGQG